MADRPRIPTPAGEMSPRDLCKRIQKWAQKQGYTFELTPHASEFGKVILRDPNGGQTIAVVPNPHHGRRIKKHQVRYTIQDLNANWED